MKEQKIELDFSKLNGLIPVVTQDAETGKVLMQAFLNQEAWEATLKTGFAHYYSRSRKGLWKKGESSGNLQVVKSIRVDCDLDSVLFSVHQQGGAACHMGYVSCYFRELTPSGEVAIVEDRLFDPDEVYSSSR